MKERPILEGLGRSFMLKNRSVAALWGLLAVATLPRMLALTTLLLLLRRRRRLLPLGLLLRLVRRGRRVRLVGLTGVGQSAGSLVLVSLANAGAR